MTEQNTWIPLPRRRPPKIKIADAIDRFNRLADWYEENKPTVKRIVVSAADYKSFLEAAGKGSVTYTDGVLRYRGFVIEATTEDIK
jgi:hypothetical protein